MRKKKYRGNGKNQCSQLPILECECQGQQDSAQAEVCSSLGREQFGPFYELLRGRHWDSLQYFLDRLIRIGALHPGLSLHDHPVHQSLNGNLLHIIRHNIVATMEDGAISTQFEAL